MKNIFYRRSSLRAAKVADPFVVIQSVSVTWRQASRPAGLGGFAGRRRPKEAGRDAPLHTNRHPRAPLGPAASQRHAETLRLPRVIEQRTAAHCFAQARAHEG